MKNFTRNKENLLFGTFFLIVILSYKFFHLTDTVLIGVIGSIATIYLGVIKLKVDDDNLFKELFNTFNERYDQRFNDLINRQRIEPKELEDEEKIVIIDYFNLCAEEYLWYKRGRIPKNVWIAWKAGIINNLQLPEINKLWHQEMKGNGIISYYGISTEIFVSEII
jgi:hypothetical protein